MSGEFSPSGSENLKSGELTPSLCFDRGLVFVERSANFLLPCYSCPKEKFIKIAACIPALLAANLVFVSCLLSEKAILSLIVLLSNSHTTFESRGGLWLCISMSISDYGDLDYFYA